MLGKKKKEVEIPDVLDYTPLKRSVKHPYPKSKGKKVKPKSSGFLWAILILVVAVIIINHYFPLFDFFEIEPEIIRPFCGDGTPFQECSSRRPYFCDNGTLIEKASSCGCLSGTDRRENHCSTRYQTNPKSIGLNYILRGEEEVIRFTVYKGLVDHISSLSKTINYVGGEKASRLDFKIRNVNNLEQRILLLPLVTEIQNRAGTVEEQARIAISLVQHIPYGSTNKTIDFQGRDVSYSRYPYEVLYDFEGVCGERTELLAFLLRELGYDVAFLYYQLENHEALGIKCPIEYGLTNTSYCFIETTGPSIITDNGIRYIGGLTLNSQPEIMSLSEGRSFPPGMYEFEDAQEWKEIRTKVENEGRLIGYDYVRREYLMDKYGLVSIYRA